MTAKAIDSFRSFDLLGGFTMPELEFLTRPSTIFYGLVLLLACLFISMVMPKTNE